MHFITIFLYCIKLITATVYTFTSLQLSKSQITEKHLRKHFSFPPTQNGMPPCSRSSMSFTEPQGTLTCSDEPYDNQFHQHQIGNSCLILLTLVFTSPSNPCGTAQSAQWLGYGLQDLQEICPFSNISTQATSPTHSAIQLVPQALILKVGRAWVSPLTSICCDVNSWSYTSTALVKNPQNIMGKKLYPSIYAHDFLDLFIWPQ